MNYILESVKRVADLSEDVRINMERMKAFSKSYDQGPTSWEDFLPYKPPVLSDGQKAAFTFVYCSQNFCFWGSPKWETEHQGKHLGGAFGMMAALHRAIEEGHDLLNPSFLEQVSLEEVKTILRGNTEIPLLKERQDILREVGRVVNQKYGGSFAEVIRGGGKDALKLLQNVARDFPSYNDVSMYKGEPVYLFKRAQLMIHDLYTQFGGEGFGEFSNIEELTAFADYKIPAILRRLGILEYSERLSAQVDSEKIIAKGSPEEAEIRANMVWAVELIRQNVTDPVSAADIDMYLWLEGKKSPDSRSHHRTLTTSY